MENLELLKSLYKVYSPSGGEKNMRSFIKRIAKKYGADNIERDKAGNLFVTKGTGAYPCVVAHMDQVQRLHSKDFDCYVLGDIIMGYSQKNKRQEGLGADDKNGIFIALECLRKYDNIKLAFFVEEETGTVGSSQADITFFQDCRFVVQCDRKGNGDFVDSICCTTLCSDDFINAVSPASFGYRLCDGGLTDVLSLREKGLEISCCNMSCGYYNPHTDEEVTSLSDLENCRDFVFSIIDNCTDVYPYEYQSPYRHTKRNFNFDDSVYDDDFDKIDSILSWDPNLSFSELMEYYGTSLHSSYEDLKDIYYQLTFVYYPSGEKKEAK